MQKIVKQGEEVVVDLVVEDMEYVVHVRYIIFSIISTVQSQFSDILFSDKSRFSDNFAEDHFFST